MLLHTLGKIVKSYSNQIRIKLKLWIQTELRSFTTSIKLYLQQPKKPAC